MPEAQSRAVRWTATVDDLYHVPEHGKAELVDGKLVLITAETQETPQVYRRGETARAEPALPGWFMAVDDLLETG